MAIYRSTRILSRRLRPSEWIIGRVWWWWDVITKGSALWDCFFEADDGQGQVNYFLEDFHKTRYICTYKNQMRVLLNLESMANRRGAVEMSVRRVRLYHHSIRL